MDKLLYTFFDKNLISIKSGHRIYLNSKNNKTFTVGKNIFLKLKNNQLFNFHLGMTGGWSQHLIKHCHFRVFSKSKELYAATASITVFTDSSLPKTYVFPYSSLFSLPNLFPADSTSS